MPKIIHNGVEYGGGGYSKRQIDEKLKLKLSKSSIDTVLSDDSINPVQNKVVTKALNGKISQVKIMPTPSENELGKIVQYVGRTTGGYIKGFFYRCAEISDTDPTEYEWVNQEVQESTDGEAKVNATAVTSLSGLADGFYLLIDSTATPIYQLKEVVSGVATDSDKEVDTCLIDYVLYNDNKTTLDTLDIVWVVTGTPDVSDYKTEFETAKSGIRNDISFKIEWDEDILANGNFADLKAQWDSLGAFLYNNRGRLALITVDQYNFGFSDDDTSGSTPTLFCIVPDRADTNEEYKIRVPYGSALSIHGDGYGTGFFDINLRFHPNTNKCEFAGINTTLFKGTQLMSTGYAYNGTSTQEVRINEGTYNMTDATERAAAYNLYHQGVTITIKLL